MVVGFIWGAIRSLSYPVKLKISMHHAKALWKCLLYLITDKVKRTYD